MNSTPSLLLAGLLLWTLPASMAAVLYQEQGNEDLPRRAGSEGLSQNHGGLAMPRAVIASRR